MLVNGRKIALTFGLVVCLASQAVQAQCGGGGSGRSGFGVPASTSATSSGVPYNPVSSNNAAFQVALASQRQQMEVMYRQMMIQQSQIAAMQQQLAMNQAAERQAKQQEAVAARKERVREKESQKATKLASARLKQNSVQ